MDKILILDCTGNDWTDNHLRRLDKVDVEAIYKQVGIFLRIIRRIHYKTRIPFKHIWYGGWLERLTEYKVIIIFQSLFGNEIFGYIRNRGYDGRLICYYRDTQDMKWIREGCHADELKALRDDVELWTFDGEDAENYGMRYNPQFYFEIAGDKPHKIKYDAIFIGAAHSREKEINGIYNKLKSKCLMLNFIVQHDEKYRPKKINGINYITNNMDYEQIIHANCQSRCIVEIMNGKQQGMTVRALEALFLRCKLITNNIAIKEMDFYHPDNIFIDGVDDWDEILGWLKRPFREIPLNIRNEYLASRWLERFFINN